MPCVEIRVRGRLDREWTEWLGELTITHPEEGQTLLAGRMSDTAQLYGLMARLRDLGVELVSVKYSTEGLNPLG
jgi:hypothetical protein